MRKQANILSGKRPFPDSPIPQSGTLNFGVLLNGTGKVWFDDITFDIVDKQNTKTTDKQSISTNALPNKPANIDFEK